MNRGSFRSVGLWLCLGSAVAEKNVRYFRQESSRSLASFAASSSFWLGLCGLLGSCTGLLFVVVNRSRPVVGKSRWVQFLAPLFVLVGVENAWSLSASLGFRFVWLLSAGCGGVSVLHVIRCLERLCNKSFRFSPLLVLSCCLGFGFSCLLSEFAALVCCCCFSFVGFLTSLLSFPCPCIAGESLGSVLSCFVIFLASLISACGFVDSLVVNSLLLLHTLLCVYFFCCCKIALLGCDDKAVDCFLRNGPSIDVKPQTIIKRGQSWSPEDGLSSLRANIDRKYDFSVDKSLSLKSFSIADQHIVSVPVSDHPVSDRFEEHVIVSSETDSDCLGDGQIGAVTSLQARFRGNRARAFFADLKTRTMSACRIQARYRGRLVRKRVSIWDKVIMHEQSIITENKNDDASSAKNKRVNVLSGLKKFGSPFSKLANTFFRIKLVSKS